MEQQDPMKQLAEMLLAQFKPEEVEEMKRKYNEMVEEQTKLQLQKMQGGVKDVDKPNNNQ